MIYPTPSPSGGCIRMGKQRRKAVNQAMQIVTDQNPLPLPRAEEIEQFLSQHNANGFALFCWNTDEAKSFSAMQANLPVYAACEGIYADSLQDLVLMVIQRWCRRDTAIREAEKQKTEEFLELDQQAA